MNVPINVMNDRNPSLYQRPPPITDMIQLSKTSRCVIYARCSTIHQEFSIDSQIDFCKKWLERKGLQVARIYRDQGRTGTTDKGRKGLKALKTDLKAPWRDWDLVVAFRIDRYFRNARLFIEHEYHFLDHGVYLMSAQEEMLNRTDSMTSVFRYFTAHQAEAEAYKIGENVQRGKLSVARGAEHGKWMGGVAPIAFDVVDGVLMINAKERIIIEKRDKEYMQDAVDTAKPKRKREDCVEYILKLLAESGNRMPTKSLEEKASDEGYSVTLVRRAKDQLKAEVELSIKVQS